MSDAAKHAAEMRILRSPLGRARGLGSAKAGTADWWAGRVTSVALVPLTIWFVFFGVLGHLGATQPQMAHWIGNPINAVLLLSLVLATFYHLQLGLQVVIEDYIHTELTKLASLLALKGVCILLGLASLVAVLKLAFN
jgi:succinate dehydrogenase / fumarate reductase membrane anchor subunit